MNKIILCYGDSNTYGYNPLNGLRYSKDIRWTGCLQKLLGEEYSIIEEGCIFCKASEYIKPSKVDSLHLMPEEHKKLAEVLKEIIIQI